MAQRRWGVNLAPGTAVVERDGIPQLSAGLLGGAAFIGACEKGPVGEVITCFSWKDFLSKCGDVMLGTYLPDAVKGFWQESQGNGRVFVVRATDGNEIKSSLSLYNSLGTIVLTVTAKSGGAWAGKRAILVEDDLSAAITVESVAGNVVTVSYRGDITTYPLGFWKGGYIQRLDGSTWTSFEIVGDATSDAITVRNVGDLAAEDEIRLVQFNPKALSIVVKESPQDPTRWNLLGYYNGNLVVSYENLSLDPDDDRFCETVVNKDDSNVWFTLTKVYSGTDYTTNRPYNDYGKVLAAPTTNQVTITTRGNGSNLTLAISDYVGGYLYKVGAVQNRNRISAASLSTSDIVLTLEGTVDPLVWAQDAPVFIEFPAQLGGGYDGDITSLSTEVAALLEVSTSPLNTLNGDNNGLIKIATPGYGGDATVAKAGIALAEALNFQYRVEPANNVGPEAYKAWVETSVGRSDFAKTHYPGWMLIREGNTLKQVPVVGDVLGEEARFAAAYSGYYKASAGLDAVLSRCLGFVVGSDTDFKLQMYHVEYLNPAGVNCLLWKKGNATIWGARTLSSTNTWRWAHMREQMSHYEHLLLEGYDWIIFAINNPDIWPVAYNNLEDYFTGEWKKGAIYGNTFEDACAITVNGTNNTAVSMDAGELNADVSLQFSGVVERFVISIGRASLTEKTLG